MQNIYESDKTILLLLQRNAYWAHLENILLAAISDESKDIRTETVNLILLCRQGRIYTFDPVDYKIRKFVFPN